VRLLSLKLLNADKGIPYTRAHLLRLMERGEFPRSIHLGPNRVAWIESEIDDWIAARVAAREQDADTASAAMKATIARRREQRSARRGRRDKATA